MLFTVPPEWTRDEGKVAGQGRDAGHFFGVLGLLEQA